MPLELPDPAALFAPRRGRLASSIGDGHLFLYRGDAPFFEDLYYLSGLNTYNTALLVDLGTGGATAWTWEVEATVARAQTDVAVSAARNPWAAATEEISRRHPASLFVSLSDPRAWVLAKDLADALPGTRCLDGTGVVGARRRAKDAWERSCLAEAARVAAEVMASTRRGLREGVSERDVAAQIVRELIEAGSTRPSVPIVAFGENTAEVHHAPGPRVLRSGDLVLIDIFGEVAHHYCAEQTDTFVYGEAEPKTLFRLQAVEAALHAAQLAMGVGSTLRDVEAVVADTLEHAGFGSEYPGACTHHVGLSEHDPTQKDEQLEGGSVIAVEPSLYSRSAGIRTERVVFVGA